MIQIKGAPGEPFGPVEEGCDLYEVAQRHAGRLGGRRLRCEQPDLRRLAS
jgi:hypothetical protein